MAIQKYEVGNPAQAGAYVAMDPSNGEVLALGSYPSFDANLFAKPLSQEKFDALRAFGAEVIVCPTNVEPDDPRARDGHQVVVPLLGAVAAELHGISQPSRG